MSLWSAFENIFSADFVQHLPFVKTLLSLSRCSDVSSLESTNLHIRLLNWATYPVLSQEFLCIIAALFGLVSLFSTIHHITLTLFFISLLYSFGAQARALAGCTALIVLVVPENFYKKISIFGFLLSHLVSLCSAFETALYCQHFSAI